VVDTIHGKAAAARKKRQTRRQAKQEKGTGQVNQPSDVLKSFMLDFWSQTKPHPFLKYISHFSVRDIPVVDFQVASRDGHIWLENIHSWQEGHGYGSMALDWFCSLADKHQVEIRGSIYPPGGGRMNVDELTAWYQRHGFTVNGREISREPKPIPEESCP
jgi:hypothetical protein